jgi:hypothetical protein
MPQGMHASGTMPPLRPLELGITKEGTRYGTAMMMTWTGAQLPGL